MWKNINDYSISWKKRTKSLEKGSKKNKTLVNEHNSSTFELVQFFHFNSRTFFVSLSLEKNDPKLYIEVL